MKLGRFLYVSVSCLDKSEAATEIARIVDEARERNAANKITGALVFSGNRFGQYLEGPIDALHGLVDRIRVDSRHEDFTAIFDEPTNTRRFADWTLFYAGQSFYLDKILAALFLDGDDPQLRSRNTDRLLRLMSSPTSQARFGGTGGSDESSLGT